MIWRIMYCSLVLLCFFSSIVQGQINHLVTFSSDMQITEETLDDGETYTWVSMPDLQQTDSVGYPALPVRYVKLLIPANARVDNVVVNTSKKQVILLKHHIEPLQNSVPINQSNLKQEFIKPNKKRYNSETPYPADLVEIVENGYFREDHLVTLAVYPCLYYPKRNELEQYESIDFTLNYGENAKKQKEQVKVRENGKHIKILESMIDNKDDLEKYAVSSIGVDTESSLENLKSVETTMAVSGVSGFSDCDYIVVTSAELALAFNEFMAWKRRKGIIIGLVTIEDIKANYTGDLISGINDDAGKLREFLFEEFYNPLKDNQYALLAGDQSIVPIRYGSSQNNTWTIYPESPNDAKIPTDLYFADFNGDWDLDGDQYLGEPNDGVDFNPEIYIGRIMVKTEDEIKSWVKKIMNYERNPGDGNYSYLKKAFYTQADHLQDYLLDGQARYIAKKFYSVFNDTLIWEEMKDGMLDPNSDGIPDSPLGRNIISKFNEHYGFCSFFAHGSPRSIAIATDGMNDWHEDYAYALFTKDEYDVTLPTGAITENGNGFDNMNNYDYPSIYYSISCETTPFDDYNHDSDIRNMGEGFTVLGKGGGPAYLGNTRYGWVASSYQLFDQFIKVITDNTSYHFGVAEAISKQNYNNRYLRFSHNLIGCPETEMWTATPARFTNVSINRGYNNTLVVETGVSNCTICVMSALDNGASYYEVVEGVSDYSFYPPPPEDCLVTITKHNYIPYLKDPDNIYIQNESIYSERYIYGKYFYAGENVTTSEPQGPVIIQNGSNVIFDRENEVQLKAGFEVRPGATFEIKK